MTYSGDDLALSFGDSTDGSTGTIGQKGVAHSSPRCPYTHFRFRNFG